VYGPPDTNQPHNPPVGNAAPPVLEPFNFLNPDAGWRGAAAGPAQIHGYPRNVTKFSDRDKYWSRL
jgi:hypothetical protein